MLFDLGSASLPCGYCSNDCSNWGVFRDCRQRSLGYRHGCDQGRRTTADSGVRFAQSWGSRGREFKSRQPDQTDPPHPTWSDLHSTDILAALDNAERRPLRTRVGELAVSVRGGEPGVGIIVAACLPLGDEMHTESETAGSHASLVERLLLGGWTAQVLRTAALLRLSDQLASGVNSLDELAVATGTEPAALARFLRACVLLGLCTDQGGHFELAPAGDALRSDVPGSLRPAALLLTAPWVQHAWETLPEAVRTGRETFSTALGTDFWSYLAGHPRDQADFDQAMAASSIERARAVLAACTFDGLETIVDVGGGTGRFLAELLAAVPHIRGVLADRAEVVAGAGEVLAETGVADRCDVVPTDFFHPLVSGGDVYVLVHILHDGHREMGGDPAEVC